MTAGSSTAAGRRGGFGGGLQIGEGLNAVDLAGLDQGGDAAPSDAAFVVTCKKRVLATDSDWSDQVFDAVVVDLEAAVGQQGLQPILVVMDIGEFLTQPRFAGDLATLCLKPVAEGGHQRCNARLTGGEALAGRDAAGVGLDGIELGDTAQALGGDL